MAFILLRDRPHNSIEEWRDGFAAYTAYLETVRERLPAAAYEFASAEWHYNFFDHRAPHDGRLESLEVREPASGDRQQERFDEIAVRLLTSYHDGRIELIYRNVSSYSLDASCSNHVGHGDWLYDEVRLSGRGRVLHEVEWSEGGFWRIECGDIEYRWLPFAGR